MNMPSAIAVSVIAIALFGGLSVPSAINAWKRPEIVVSCNNLKATAIAASQPEPRCAQ